MKGEWKGCDFLDGLQDHSFLLGLSLLSPYMIIKKTKEVRTMSFCHFCPCGNLLRTMKEQEEGICKSCAKKDLEASKNGE